MVTAQRPPHVPRLDATFDQLRGRGAVLRQHMRLQQPRALDIAELGLDEAMKIGQTHATTVTPPPPTPNPSLNTAQIVA